MTTATNEKIDKAELFQKHLPMARKMAHEFAANYKRPVAEMIDEAEGILELVCTRWDQTIKGRDGRPRKFHNGACSPSTFIYRRLYWDMTSIFRDAKRSRKDQCSTFTDMRVGESLGMDMGRSEKCHQVAAKPSWFEQLCSTLSEDAKIVVKTILFAPGEILADINPLAPKKARPAVHQHLTKEEGWNTDRFDQAWQEVEGAL